MAHPIRWRRSPTSVCTICLQYVDRMYVLTHQGLPWKEHCKAFNEALCKDPSLEYYRTELLTMGSWDHFIDSVPMIGEMQS